MTSESFACSGFPRTLLPAATLEDPSGEPFISPQTRPDAAAVIQVMTYPVMSYRELEDGSVRKRRPLTFITVQVPEAALIDVTGLPGCQRNGYH